MLVAPGGFARFIATPTPLQGPYAVVGVASGDVLNIRGGAGINFAVVGSYPSNTANVMKTGLTQTGDGAEWWQVQKDGTLGWVNSSYLTEYVAQDVFCADMRVNALIDQLKGSMLQSNGDMFGALVSPKHGASVNFWRDVPPVVYNSASARNVFSDATIYNWGTSPAGGPTGTSGTFAQVVQADLVDVFNSSYQLGCDNPSYASGMSANPWPNTNIHYYSIVKPPSSAVFDWKVWLIGFEYVDGKPYLYSTVHYIWSP
jgi:hypothetical protein